jgi:hypothetical protein
MDAKEREVTTEPGKRIREDLDEDARPRRPWLLIVASLLFAALAAWTGVQWKQGADRETKLRAELKQVYLEAENLRTVATQWQARAILLRQQAAALTVERDGLAKRLGSAEAELAALKTQRRR